MQTPKAMICKSREDQNHWRARAEAARVHAQQMIEPVTKGMMVEVAEYYESLARRAGGRLFETEKLKPSHDPRGRSGRG